MDLVHAVRMCNTDLTYVLNFGEPIKLPIRYLLLLFLVVLLLFTLIFLLREHSLLRTPKLAVQSVSVNELLMCALLCNTACPKHNDDIGVVDSAQSVRNEHRCALLLAHKRIDVREQCLLGMGIERGCLVRLVLVSNGE
jgi:hypothetical protein